MKAAVKKLQGANLNSPSVLVLQEMMFQSVEERSFLKASIDNQREVESRPPPQPVPISDY